MKGTVCTLIALLLMLVAIMAHETVYAADRIEMLRVADSAEVETGAGETPWVLIETFEKPYETGRIELLRPADSAEVDVSMGAGEAAEMKLLPVEIYETGRIELLRPAN